MSRTYSVLLAEPNMLLREKIASVLARDERIWCVTQVDKLSGLTRGIASLQPDFVLADIVILLKPEILELIRRSSADTRVIALVDKKSKPYIEAARCIGLDGIIEKGLVEDGILSEIRKLNRPG